VSLNPVVHTDPIGTLLLPVIAMVSNAPMIGWARPTPVNVRNLKHPRRDHILVTAAGPASNLVLAIAAAMVLHVMPLGASSSGVDIAAPLTAILSQALLLNVLLAVFNLLPIPPLDGGQIMMALLPRHVSARLGFLYEYGFLILMVLLVLGVLEVLIVPPYYLILSWLR
jgi:Zn-dependent protease